MSVGAVNKQTGERIPTAGMPAVDSVLSGSSTNPVQNMVVKAALDEKADTDLVASDFNATASYTAGNYCIYEGKFYRFKNNHTGAWAAADVDEIQIAGELSSIKSGLTNLAGLKFLPVTFTDTFEANSNITNGVTVSALTGGVLTSENQIKGIIMFNGYPYFLFQLTYQGKIILGTDTARLMQETINVRMVILY